MVKKMSHQQGGKELVHKMVTEGPVNVASASGRRVRATFGGHWVFDTTEALHVWEHKYYPQFYIPWSALRTDSSVRVDKVEGIEEEGKTVASVVRISAGEESSTEDAVFFEDVAECGKLRGLLRITFSAMEQWYEEDTPIYVHPRDPTKRIDILPSTRAVEVRVGSHVVARASAALHLIEPMLPVRYYLPPTSVDVAGGGGGVRLRASATRTSCPYKGDAEYYDIVIGDDGGAETHRDLVWWYRYPTHECAAIQGQLCFYNEKCDVYLDGEKLEQPESHFV